MQYMQYMQIYLQTPQKNLHFAYFLQKAYKFIGTKRVPFSKSLYTVYEDMDGSSAILFESIYGRRFKIQREFKDHMK